MGQNDIRLLRDLATLIQDWPTFFSFANHLGISPETALFIHRFHLRMIQDGCGKGDVDFERKVMEYASVALLRRNRLRNWFEITNFFRNGEDQEMKKLAQRFFLNHSLDSPRTFQSSQRYESEE